MPIPRLVLEKRSEDLIDSHQYPKAGLDDDWVIVPDANLKQLQSTQVGHSQSIADEIFNETLRAPSSRSRKRRTEDSTPPELCHPRAFEPDPLAQQIFRDYLRNVITADIDLSNAIVHLQRELAKHRKVVEVAERYCASLQQQTTPPKPDTDSESSRASRHIPGPAGFPDEECSVTTDSRIPTVVEEHFKVLRVAFIAKERIAELDADYEQRTTLSDDLDCATSYHMKRRELMQALSAAEQEAVVRREKCLARGIDPENFRYRRPTPWIERIEEELLSADAAGHCLLDVSKHN